MKSEYHVLNLGAGVQSTALYLMFMESRVEYNGRQVKLDAAVFADTQDEPRGKGISVYEHLEWLKSLNGPPILTRTKGRLSADLMKGENSTEQRFASIPAYTKSDGDEKEGRVRRQCSKEYKIEVIMRAIRQDILGLRKGRPVPKGVLVYQYIGISLDEAGRAKRMLKVPGRFPKWTLPRFPLVERWITRGNCLAYLHDRCPHEVPRSACVYCPFHDDAEWLRIKASSEDWKLAVEVDEALRRPGTVVNRKMDKSMYLHRSCQPLVQIDFKPREDLRQRQSNINFASECLGVCGV